MKGNATRGYAMVFAAACLWGAIGIFVNAATAMGLASQSTAALRLLFGAIVLAPILILRRGRGSSAHGQGQSAAISSAFHLGKKAFVPTALVGTVGLALANFLYYESIGSVGISTASVLLYTSPIFATALGRVLYKEEICAQKLVAVGMNFTGCILTVTNGGFLAFEFSWYGVLAGVGAALGGALLAIFSSKASAEEDPLAVTFWAFVVGAVFMGAVSFPWNDVRQAMSLQLILLFGAFGTISTALAYILYMTGLAHGLEASKVPVVASAETAVAAVVGIALYGEQAGAIKVLGIYMVLASILVMNMTPRRQARSAIGGYARESFGFSSSGWQRKKEDELRLLRERLASAGGVSQDQDSWKSWLYVR